MTDYNLAALSTRSFEHLTQALAGAVIGPGVVIFGDGPDGAREATYQGPLAYGQKKWNGYLVFQAKFLQKPTTTRADGPWLLQQLTLELGKFTDRKRNLKKPDYYVLATNVALSSVSRTGTKDKVFKLLADFMPRVGYKDWDIWDADKIRTFLDSYRDIATTYSPWITSGDVLHRLMELLEGEEIEVEDTLATFLKKELLNSKYANLEQAGHASEQQVPLAGVFIDLPVSDKPLYEPEEGGSSGFTQQIIESARDVFRSGQAKASEAFRPGGRFVLIGGPGQGKTTLGQYICQLFRAAVIEHCKGNPAEVREALRGTQAQCVQDRVQLPSTKRFPLQIILSEFARAIASEHGPKSLLEYLATKFCQRTNQKIEPHLLKKWLGVCPWLMILDGLDEVPSSSNRSDVLQAIEEFWVDAAEVGADLLVVVTTRPQDYSFELSPKFYEHKYLVPLSPNAALKYASRLVEVRYGGDSDRRTKVLSRLRRASREIATARLMRSPLQVTIMATLVDRIGQPPQQRWALFKEYYNVIYNREVERAIPAAAILRDQRSNIDAIHYRTGLLLQVECERTGTTDAKLTTARFSEIVRIRLKSEGYEGQELEILSEKIISAAAHRLVFLVGLEADRVGFEIRSLQEFMAAEGLMDGSDEDVRGRLRHLGPLVQWRNVVLFAAGKCYADRAHLRETIQSICADLNDDPDDDGVRTILGGSQLALDLLEDGTARSQPKHSQSLARLALRLLSFSNPDMNARMAGVFQKDYEGVYRDELVRLVKTTSDSGRAAAWGVAASLAANNEWAQELAEFGLREHGKDEIDEFVSAIRSIKIAGALHPKIVGLLPTGKPMSAEIYTNSRERFDSKMPTWLKSFRRAVNPHFRMTTFIPLFLPSGATLISVGVSSICQNWLRGLQSTPHANHANKEWKEIIGFSKFLAKPCGRRLAESLRNAAEHPDRPFLLNEPWVIKVCKAAGHDAPSLHLLAQMAENGALGDSEHWRAAEERWRRGIQVSELYDLVAKELPMSQEIGVKGCPVEAIATFTSNSRGKDATGELSESVEFVRSHTGSNRAGILATWILSLIYGPDGEFLTHISAELLLPLLTAVGGGSWYVDVSWLTPAWGFLEKDVDRFLNIAEKIGGAGRVYLTTRRVLPAPITHALADGFVSNPRRIGLLPILRTIALSGSSTPIVIPAVLLRPQTQTFLDGNIRSAAFTLWVLQSDWQESPSSLADLLLAEPAHSIRLSLNAVSRSQAPEKLRTALVRELLERSQDHLVQGDCIRTMTNLVKARTSSLSDTAECSRLRLPSLSSA